MDIIVDVAKTIAEIEQEKIEYAEEYEETCELFRRKLEDYSVYIIKRAKEGNLKSLESPPYPPTDQMSNFERSIKMLRAHTATTLKMNDSEYGSLMSEIKAQKMFNASTTSTLSSLSY